MDVFISYKQEERNLIIPIAEALRELRIAVWFDMDMKTHQPFTMEIQRELRSAKCVVVCWSKRAAESPWVHGEAMFGFHENKLVSTYVDPKLHLIEDLPPPFSIIHATAISGWTQNEARRMNDPGWLTVVDGIQKLLGRNGLVEWIEIREDQSLGEVARIQKLEAWAELYPDDPLVGSAWTQILEIQPTHSKARLALEALNAPQLAPAYEETEAASEQNLILDQEVLDKERSQGQAWTTVDKKNAEEVRRFIDNWVDGPFVDLARFRLEAIGSDLASSKVDDSTRSQTDTRLEQLSESKKTIGLAGVAAVLGMLIGGAVLYMFMGGNNSDIKQMLSASVQSQIDEALSIYDFACPSSGELTKSQERNAGPNGLEELNAVRAVLSDIEEAAVLNLATSQAKDRFLEKWGCSERIQYHLANNQVW